MAISIPPPILRVFAFLSNIWSFILTLVRSLLALFSFRHRSGDPFALPRVNRTRKDALARAHQNLKPILLTSRTLTSSSESLPDDTQLGRPEGTRTPSALTLFPGCNDHPSVAASATSTTPPSTIPQRTSPKLDPNDAELGRSAVVSSNSGAVNRSDHSGPGPASTCSGLLATTSREVTPDTSTPMDNNTTSSSSLPLTPPDPCYLGPVPSTTDCPYTEPWPTSNTFDRSKQKLPGSPLRMSFGNESRFPNSVVQTWHPESPHLPLADGPWSTVPIWTSTPRKQEKENVAPDDNVRMTTDHAPIADVPQPITTRTRPVISAPYDNRVLHSSSSFNLADRDRKPRQAPIPRARANVTNVNHPGMYTWRRQNVRLPGKPSHAQTHSQSHIDLRVDRPIVEWYDDSAYVPSPIIALSPPMDEDEDEDEVPLSRLLKLRARQRVGLGVGRSSALGGKRVVSDGVLVLGMHTPTRVGMGGYRAREGRTVKDTVEVPFLRFSDERVGSKDEPAEMGTTTTTTTTVPAPATATDVFSAGASGVPVGVVEVV